MSKGFMRISRERMSEWRWLQNQTKFYVFFRLLLKANFKDLPFEKTIVRRGQLIFSYDKLSAELGISLQTLRTTLKDLQETKDIIIQSTRKSSLLTICEYESWQEFIDDANTQPTYNQHTTNIQITLSKEIEELKKENERLKEELTKVSKKKDDNSNYAELFEKFRLKYREYGGKVRGLETEFENLKKKHKDWKEIIPLLSDAIEKENSERKRARALGKFFHEMKNLQTYINQRSWEIYTEDDIHLDNENEYRPLSDDVMQRWNPARKCLEVNTPYLNMLNDGYTDDNRPDGATVAWQMYSWKWSTDRKEWVKQE